MSSMLREIIWVFILLSCLVSFATSTFTCQGSSYKAALTACPDQGSQEMSNGGNVTIRVVKATNVPNKDNPATVAQLSDPYVRFSVGAVVRETRVVTNSLNPTWEEEVNLGYLGSATEVLVEIWDQDSGLEFSDDLLGRTTIRVPFCSSFHANVSTYNCGQPFGCGVTDSLWQMPARKMCNESGTVSFDSSTLCTASGSFCLYLDIMLVPFQMAVELTYKASNIQTPVVNVAGPVTKGTWTSGFGRPFIGSSSVMLDSSIDGMRKLKGALMMQTLNAERSRGKANAVKYYASTNFPATIYICRFEDDNTNGIPSWISSDYSAEYIISRTLEIRGTNDVFRCFFHNVTGTVKNRYGGVVSGAFPIRTNTIAGHDSGKGSDLGYYKYNFVVLAVPIVSVLREENVIIYYDAAGFLSFFGSYGLICLWFIFLAYRFLKRVDFRIDRITNFIVSRVLTGEDRSLIAALLLTNNDSPCNFKYRAYIYHARNIILMFLGLPFLLLLSWGLSVSLTVRPPLLGMLITFVGSALLLSIFGFSLWHRSSWRMSLMSLTAMGLGASSFLLYLLISLFLDVNVLHKGKEINFVALSLIFGAINCIPCLILIFKQDRSHQVYMEKVVDKMASAVALLKGQQSSEKHSSNENTSLVNRMLHAILGESYAINPKLPALQFSTVVAEVELTYHSAISSSKEPHSKSKMEMIGNLLNTERKIYGVSMLVLFVYLMIAIARTSNASLAFLNICALLLLDFIHMSVSKGECNWSPGFKVALLVSGRILICSSPRSIWMVNYSACYVLYAVTMTHELIDVALPKLTMRRAGELVFGGAAYHESIRELLKTNDISGSSGISFLLLMISFLAVIIVAAYMPKSPDGTHALLVPTLNVLGMHSWPAYVFGLIAFLVTSIVGLAMATKRIFDLDFHGLLRGWAKEMYLLRPNIKLPTVFAVATELSILFSGLLLYAVTNAPAVLVGSIFLPVIIVCFSFVGRTWVKNDYVLVVWPRKDVLPEATATIVGGSTGTHQTPHGGDDLAEAFHMIESMFGQNTEDGSKYHPDDVISIAPETNEDVNAATESEMNLLTKKQTLMGGFVLPPLRPTGNKLESKDIKMPPLPLKSVLRRKRQNMGIKTQGLLPLIKDLNGAPGKDNNDQFGNKKDDVIDITDPWAQFELSQEEEALLKKKKKKGVTVAAASSAKPTENKGNVAVVDAEAAKTSSKSSFSYIELVKSIRRFWRTNKYVRQCMGTISSMQKYVLRKKKIHPVDGEGEEGLDDDDAEEEDEPLILDEHVDISKLQFWDAFWSGYLTRDEYFVVWSWFGGLFAVMLFGIVLGMSVNPPYLGFAVWAAIWLGLFFYVPIYKYFQVYSFDATAWQMFKFGFFIHFIFCLTFFVGYLQGNAARYPALWILDFFIYFPLLTYWIFFILKWVDSKFKLAAIDGDGDGQISLQEVIKFMQTFPAMLAFVIILNWQFYVWINYTVGIAFTLILLVFSFAYVFIKDWASNDYFLSPELASFGSFAIEFTIFISFMVALCRPGFSTAYPVSVCCFAIGFRYALSAFNRYSILDKSSIFFFSPFLFPVYSYSTATQYLVDESTFIMDMLMIIFYGILWGVLMMVFYAPLDVGMSIACVVVLATAAAIVLCVSFIPRRLAKSNVLLSPESVLEAANYAQEKFLDRRRPLNLEMSNFDSSNFDASTQKSAQQIPAEKEEETKSMLDRLKEKTSLENALAILADVRALKYVKNDSLFDALDENDNDEEAVHDNGFQLTMNSTAGLTAPKGLKAKKKSSGGFFGMFGLGKKGKTDKISPREGAEENKDDEEARSLVDGQRSQDEQSAPKDESDDEDEDEYEESWMTMKWTEFKAFVRRLHELLPVHKTTLYAKHQQAPFSVADAAREMFMTGRGPFGLLGVDGLLFQHLLQYKDSKLLSFLYPEWSENFDVVGNDLTLRELSEPINYPFVLQRISDCDKALDFCCKEESRCAIHFLLMLLVHADTALERERVLFQKFLRENRFRLAANGISPPKDIFTSASFASINIPLVAIWLSKLTPEEQETFHTLKESFNETQRELDDKIDSADLLQSMAARDLAAARMNRDTEFLQHLQIEISKRKELRIQAFYNSLETEGDRTKFSQRRDLWTRDPHCFVDLKDLALYDKFKAACRLFGEHSLEFKDYAMSTMLDCETAQRDTRLGEYGRQYQFVDSEFTPNETSIGDTPVASLVLGWRCSPGIVENMQLFESGTHPDDVCNGIFNDQWLLSAISMLVATTTSEALTSDVVAVGSNDAGPQSRYSKGFINEKIRGLFLSHPISTADPEHLDPLIDFTLDTEVGAYGVQIFRNNEWIPVIIDDLLPMRRKEEWTNENRGMAAAHCREGRGLWVSLIEKAYAKYYGSYSSLEVGFVHHALQDLTGCDAESIPLSTYSRGFGKLALWDRLVQYKKNGYILGAGTGSAELVDQELQDMGIMFNSAYTIYDVIEVDHHRLLKLRNPPGDHSEWKGDWSDHSTLWNRRLKHKVSFTDDEFDNTFYISFDDFLNVFRHLYVCKYYNPKTWREIKLNGFWKKSNEAEIEQLDMMNQFLIEQAADMNAETDIDQEEVNKKKARSRVDTAGGLPSQHNPGCVLENNPHYALHIYRPTDLRITVTQVPNNPKLTNKANNSHTSLLFTPQPFSIIMVRNEHDVVAQRLDSLRREDVLHFSGEPKADKSQSLYISDLQPGFYMILVGAYMAGMEGCFQISVLSHYRCELSPVWPPAWMLRDDSQQEQLSAEEQFEQRLAKSRDKAKRGFAQATSYIQRSILSLMGRGDDYEDDDTEGKSKGETTSDDLHLDAI